MGWIGKTSEANEVIKTLLWHTPCDFDIAGVFLLHLSGTFFKQEASILSSTTKNSYGEFIKSILNGTHSLQSWYSLDAFLVQLLTSLSPPGENLPRS